jgi:hypothetical protein
MNDSLAAGQKFGRPGVLPPHRASAHRPVSDIRDGNLFRYIRSSADLRSWTRWLAHAGRKAPVVPRV